MGSEQMGSEQMGSRTNESWTNVLRYKSFNVQIAKIKVFSVTLLWNVIDNKVKSFTDTIIFLLSLVSN